MGGGRGGAGGGEEAGDPVEHDLPTVEEHDSCSSTVGRSCSARRSCSSSSLFTVLSLPNEVIDTLPRPMEGTNTPSSVDLTDTPSAKYPPQT